MLRGALANMASHQGHARLVDMGSVYVEGHALEAAQQALSEAITACQQSGMRTLVSAVDMKPPGARARRAGRLSERSHCGDQPGCAPRFTQG